MPSELMTIQTDTTRPGSPTIHVCSCGRRYSATTWAQLHLVGIQDFLELRNCRRCSSTRARFIPWVSPDPADYQPDGIFSSASVSDEQRR